MIETIQGRNVNEAFNIAVLNLRQRGDLIEMDSRNGPVIMFPGPLITCYQYPDERVLLSPERNCNPFFHFMEGLWMLAGRNDLKTLTTFAKKMADFSDDGYLVNGAYGYRWRNWFGYDQLATVINILKNNPLDRRAVLQMWDCTKDLGSSSKDVPCNTQVFFRARPSKVGSYYLDMTVTNRSNDLIWGAYGANAVHFSMLHEYVADRVGLGLGRYYQVSNNAHVYKDVWEKLEAKLPNGMPIDPYDAQEVKPDVLINNVDTFDRELKNFFQWFVHGDEFWLESENKIFGGTAIPMVESWWLWQGGMVNEAIETASKIKSTDWRKACMEWLERKK